MSSPAAPATQNKASQPQRAHVVEPSPAAQGAYGEFADPGLAIMLGSSAEQQAQLLSDPGVQVRQRQRLARHIGGRHGNRQVQRLLSGSTQAEHAPKPLSNSPVTNLVARQEPPEKKKVDSLTTGMFTVTGGDATFVSGTYSTERQGEGDGAILVIHAPQVDIDYHVKFNGEEYEFEGKDGVQVGPVQVLTSAIRTGVYVKDGKEVARYSGTLNNARDTRKLSYNDAQKTEAHIVSPFYDRPTDISNDTSFDVDVHFVDRPSAPFPIHFGGGTLARIEGADNFNVSAGIKHKKSGQVLTISPTGWRANWTMSLDGNYGVGVDAEGNSTAKGIDIWEETVGQYIESETSAAKLFDSKQPIFTFTTVEAAMTESAVSLWMALAAAREADPASVVNIEAALRMKDPTFRVMLTVVKAATGRHWSLAKSDPVTVWANASKQSPDKGPASIEEGKSSAFNFKLTEIMDPASINSGSQLTVWAGGTDPNNPVLGDTIELAYPFFGSGSITVSSADQAPGTYSLNVNMI
jgi:hypothetical protein